MRPVVVKVGGSLAHSSSLEQWLGAIASGRGRTVVVPGGGPFAEQVRTTQQQAGFDDTVAHRMALLAMEQYGLMLCGLRPGLVPAGSLASIRSALHAEEIPVWMPSTMVSSDLSIPQTWDVTSDSLAAWLATRLDATELAMIKSIPIEKPLPTPEQMTARGWMDAAFAQFLSNARFDLHVFGPGKWAELQELISGHYFTG